MTSDSYKGSQTMVAYPRTILSIAAIVGGLAMFLILASLFLVSQPVGPVLHEYVYRIDRSSSLDTVLWSNKTVSHSLHAGNLEDSTELEIPMSEAATISQHGDTDIDDLRKWDSPPGLTQDRKGIGNSVSSDVTEGVKNAKSSYLDLQNKSAVTQTGLNETNPISFYTKTGAVATSAPVLNDISQTGPGDSGCDLYHGTWVYDSTGPLYAHDSCPILSQMQNCQGNGRPDKEYQNWRWKPAQCDLPRFDPKKFLELMRGKTLAFVGDSVARNQMESLMCILWQVEVPKNRGNRRMQRYYFRSTSTMIIRIWSSWLVHKTSEPFDFAPEGVVKLHLDAPDEDFMELIPNYDVLVLSSGHWFAKQSAYILNNEIVGGQLWWPDQSRPMKINNIEAFGISVETFLTAIATHPNYTGLTIVRSYSPDHYEGGAWNTGGSCTGKVRPALDGELVENGFTNIMHEKQVTGFNRATKKMTNKSKLRLMDITKAFGYRHDGHPGPYRSTDPNKITKRGPDGKPPPQDCLHWCMPGPADTWNELLLEIIRREFEGSRNFPS